MRSVAWPVAVSVLLVAVLAPAGCKTQPPALPKGAPAPSGAAGAAAAAVTSGKKTAWIYRLEQQRVLRDTSPSSADPGAPTPDLAVLAKDSDPAIRARAALALGRIGVSDAVPPLVTLLTDRDEYTRSVAAFGLGLSGSNDAVTPLQSALADTSAFVRARVIDALGLLGAAAAAAAPAIADASSGCREKLARLESDDEEYPKAPDIEACRAALFAIVRLRNYDALARLALDAQGQPISTWWPVAYALQRINDPKAAPALQRLMSSPGVYTPSFALRGLTSLKDTTGVPAALGLAARPSADVRLRAVAVRALGEIGGAAGVDALMALVEDATTPRNLALEAVTALGASGDARAFDLLLARMRDPWPSMRSAATLAATKVKPDAMLLLMPSFGLDPDWSVRASLATALAALPADEARGAIQDLTVDADMRVRSAALDALARIGAPDLATRLFDALDAPDFAVRATAARLIGEKKIDFGVERLTVAYNRGDSDAAYGARTAALQALGKYGTAAAKAVIRRGLNDRDWPVRLAAADLLRGLGDAAAAPVRPAPVRQPNDFFESPRILRPRYSPHAFVDTKYGTIEIELNVVEAPVTSALFIDLARAGFFNGIKVHRVVPNFVIQAGDPRGDGEGGPGYAIRDELSALPYLRGTVGMALDGPDSGGSQFFIAVSPQPHLDGKYTVFGRVVKGDEVLDLISQWDVIDAIRIWDGGGSDPGF